MKYEGNISRIKKKLWLIIKFLKGNSMAKTTWLWQWVKLKKRKKDSQANKWQRKTIPKTELCVKLNEQTKMLGLLELISENTYRNNLYVMDTPYYLVYTFISLYIQIL